MKYVVVQWKRTFGGEDRYEIYAIYGPFEQRSGAVKFFQEHNDENLDVWPVNPAIDYSKVQP